MKKYFILFLLIFIFVTQKYPRDIGYPKIYGKPIYTIQEIGNVKNIKLYNPVNFFKINKNLKKKTFSSYMFYNIVLEFKGVVYTYKQFVVHREYTFQ